VQIGILRAEEALPFRRALQEGHDQQNRALVLATKPIVPISPMPVTHGGFHWAQLPRRWRPFAAGPTAA
jgi:hypothetical protein